MQIRLTYRSEKSKHNNLNKQKDDYGNKTKSNKTGGREGESR